MKKNILLMMLGMLFLYFNKIYAQGIGGIPIMTTIIPDGPGGGLNSFTDENCLLNASTPIFTTNLELFPINAGIPLNEFSTFSLPPECPNMDVLYSMGPVSGSEQINTFKYGGTISTSNGVVNYFYHIIDIIVDVSIHCSEAGSSYIGMTLQNEFAIIDGSEYSETGDTIPYPVCDYLGSNDIFACEVFEICPIPNGDPCNNEYLTSGTGSTPFYCSEECLTGSFAPFRRKDKDNDISTRKLSLNESRINIYPNPFHSTVDIIIEDSGSSPHKSIEIYSSTGSLVYKLNNQQASDRKSYFINLENLPKGLYFLKVIKEDSYETKKLIKH